ncbi:M24 family metallopeptidase [soil metagenome]
MTPAATAALQTFMQSRGIDAWVLWDFRGSNPILAQLFPAVTAQGAATKRWTTRRSAIIIPRRGPTIALVHSIDASQFERDPFAKHVYLTWQELHARLKAELAGCAAVAMEYSPLAELPAVSFVDAGAVELVRALGVKVVSSADLIQATIARWSPAAQADHARVSALVTGIKDSAFALISAALAARQPITERDVQSHIEREFAAAGLQTDGQPVVAVNAHAGDPHFEVDAAKPAPITRGDWVLIDLWARTPGKAHIYSDITWVGCCGAPTAEQQQVYAAVKRARDAALRLAQDAWTSQRTVRGWELDDAARHELVSAGYEKYIRHRTGHSLSMGPKVHGLGVNLDNLETHDTREMLPGVGFTIEPGLYLPNFGVRLEINVFVDEKKGPVVTSCVQDEILKL